MRVVDTVDEVLNLVQEKLFNVKEASRIVADKYGLNFESVRREATRQRHKKEHRELSRYCEENGLPIERVRNYWYKSKMFSININARQEPKSYEDLRDEIVQAMDEHSPNYPTIERKHTPDPHLLVLDPADIHIGKLASAFETGDEYNIEIAKNRVMEGVYGILDKTSGFNIDKILFVIGNDILHIDTPKRTTTSGTPQDTDGMWYDNFLEAKRLYVKVIEVLMGVADVHVVFNPSNHDYTNGFFLADAIQSWFRLSQNITFDCSISHRKYYLYGTNLIGTTHGDGAKQNDLGLLMAHEASNYWALAKHRYFYTHHVHHKTSKDYIGLTVESLRSPSGSDSWHHRNGYVGAVKAVEGFLHHKEFGQVARITHIF